MKDVMRGFQILFLGLFAIAGHAEDILMNEDCFHYWIVSSGTVEERRQMGLGDELSGNDLKSLHVNQVADACRNALEESGK